METSELQQIKAQHDEPEDHGGQVRALVGFGIPVFVAGVALVVKGAQDWGVPAVVAGVVLGTLGLAFAVIAATLSSPRR